VLASGVLVDATGRAVFSTDALAGGTHTITATFTASGGWLGKHGR
jgi:hypothetical protein